LFKLKFIINRLSEKYKKKLIKVNYPKKKKKKQKKKKKEILLFSWLIIWKEIKTQIIIMFLVEIQQIYQKNTKN
jgi:hypothetical protein